MTKISQLSDIGGSLAAGDEFVIRDVSDISTPNKKVTASGFIDYVIAQGVGSGFTQIAAGVGPLARVLASSSGTTGTLTFSTASATTLIERTRIDSAGRLLIGTSSDFTPATSTVQINGTNALSLFADGIPCQQYITSYRNATNHSFLNFRAARGGVATPLSLPAGDNIGSLLFAGYNEAASAFQESARIDAQSDAEFGTAGDATDSPGRLVFSTTPDGASSPVERLRITSAGLVGIGTTSPSNQLQLSTDSAGKPSTNTWTIVSDERIKEEIELADLDLCYQAVKDIPLKRFKWKDEVYTDEQVKDRHKLGWIAQDVEAVYPKAVGTHEFKYNQIFEEITIPAVGEELDEEGNVLIPAQPERIAQGNLISEDVIEDCRDLNSDQLYAAMYGAMQKLIDKVETLEAEIAILKSA